MMGICAKTLTDSLDKADIVFGLMGAGGFAREVMPMAAQVLSSVYQYSPHVLVKVFFIETNPSQKIVNNTEVISENDFFAIDGKEKYFNIAIANSKARQSLAEKIILSGAKPLSLQSPTTITYDKTRAGSGAIVGMGAIVTKDVPPLTTVIGNPARLMN